MIRFSCEDIASFQLRRMLNLTRLVSSMLVTKALNFLTRILETHFQTRSFRPLHDFFRAAGRARRPPCVQNLKISSSKHAFSSREASLTSLVADFALGNTHRCDLTVFEGHSQLVTYSVFKDLAWSARGTFSTKFRNLTGLSFFRANN